MYHPITAGSCTCLFYLGNTNKCLYILFVYWALYTNIMNTVTVQFVSILSQPQHTNFLSPILRLLLSLLKTSLFSSLLSFFSKTRQNAFRPKLGNIKDWFMLTSIIPLQKQIVTHVSYRYFNSIQSRVGTYVSGDNYHLLHQNFKTVHFRCQP